MKQIIFLDFSEEKPVLGAVGGKKDFFLEASGRDGISLLPRLLKRAGRAPEAIVAVRGPGRFSAVRGGVVAANMLAHLLQIPVFGIIKKENETRAEIVRRGLAMAGKGKGSKSILPYYDAEPNITMPKAAC